MEIINSNIKPAQPNAEGGVVCFNSYSDMTYFKDFGCALIPFMLYLAFAISFLVFSLYFYSGKLLADYGVLFYTGNKR